MGVDGPVGVPAQGEGRRWDMAGRPHPTLCPQTLWPKFRLTGLLSSAPAIYTVTSSSVLSLMHIIFSQQRAAW